MRHTADVVVVGGGPAGSATAILLAQAGLHVCLLDKGHFPREKPCGEYLSPGCVPLLERLGVLPTLDKVAAPQRIEGMRVETPAGTFFTGKYPGNGIRPHGYALPRYCFDALLFEAARRAGVQCLEGWRVVDLIRSGHRVCGVIGASNGQTRRLTAPLTIGADGRNSVVARRLKLFTWHPSHRKVAFVQRFQLSTQMGSVGEVYLGRRGYCILNPQRGVAANVAVVVDQGDLPLHRPWEEVFHELLQPYPSVRAKLYRAHPVNRLRVLGPLACRVKQVAGDGFLLVGDAAGYYDPMTGEGIYQALKGAEMAAATAAEALRRGEATAMALEPYAVAYRQEFDPKEQVCQLLQHIVRNPRLCDFVVRQLRDRGDHIQELMGVVGNLLPAQRLLRPRFWTSLLVGEVPFLTRLVRCVR